MEDRQNHSLYDPRFEHDACGIGAVVDLKGGPSHQTVSDALSIVEKLRHRAGRDAAGEAGDGVGILLQVPHELFSAVGKERGIDLGGPRDYGVGMFFLPQDRIRRSRCMKLFEILLGKEGMELLFWRDVPTRPEILGQKALSCMPYIAQCFVKRPEGVAPGLNFDRRLYIVRREFEQSVTDTNIASLSCRICPAFCQRACVLGEQGEPVQIKANELFIIEFAFEKGFMLPQPPQSRSGKTAAIIGGGPAGMAAAWHLNRRGHLVTVYDQGTEPGGQLLQIPNNQLPPEIVRRRVRLMEEEGVVFKCGVTANAEELSAQYDTVVCCTGPKSKKESLVVLAIAEGKAKAAQADMDLMGFTSIEI